MFDTNVLLVGIYGISVLLANARGATISANNISTTPLPPQIAYYVSNHNYDKTSIRSETKPAIHGYHARRLKRRMPEKAQGSQQYYRYVVVPKDQYRSFVMSTPKPATAYQHFNYDVLFDNKPHDNELSGTTTAMTTSESTTETPDLPLPPSPGKTAFVPIQHPTKIPLETVRRKPDPQIHIVLRRRRKPGKVMYTRFNSAPVRKGIKILKVQHQNAFKTAEDEKPRIAIASSLRKPSSGINIYEKGLDEFDEEKRKIQQLAIRNKSRKKVPIKFVRSIKRYVRRPVLTPQGHQTIVRHPSYISGGNQRFRDGSKRQTKGQTQAVVLQRPAEESLEHEDYETSGEYVQLVPKHKRKFKPTELLSGEAIDYSSSIEDYDDQVDSAESTRYSNHLKKPRRKRPTHRLNDANKMKDYIFYITKYDADRSSIVNSGTADDDSEKNNGKKFIPARMLASVRHIEERLHQPYHKMSPGVRKRVVERGGHLVYTEDGYEEDNYDHGEEEKYAARNRHSRQDDIKKIYNNTASRRRKRYAEPFQQRKFKVPEYINMLSGDSEHFHHHRGPIEQIQIIFKAEPLGQKQGPPLRTSYYDAKVKRCEDIDFDGDQVVVNHRKKSKRRLAGLGDKIDCMREKLFGSNPFDNPLFIDTFVM